MAKNTSTVEASIQDADTVTPATTPISVSKEIGGKVYSHDNVMSLPPASLAYLLSHGWVTAFGNTAAISNMEKIKAAVKAKLLPESMTAKESGLTSDNAGTRLTAAIASPEAKAAYDTWLSGFLQARADALHADILAGDVEFGVSERLSPEEKDRRAIVMDLLKDALAKSGRKLPKEAAAIKALTDKVYSQAQARVEAEVTRRAQARATQEPMDITL